MSRRHAAAECNRAEYKVVRRFLRWVYVYIGLHNVAHTMGLCMRVGYIAQFIYMHVYSSHIMCVCMHCCTSMHMFVYTA